MRKPKAQSLKRKVGIKNSKLLVSSFSFALFALNFTLLDGCQSRDLYKESRVMMGTFVEVISPDKEAAGIVFAEIQRIENLLSKYNPDSEVSRLNKIGKLTVSPETFYILKKSKEFWQLTNGAFDITISPLMDLWGFTDKKYTVPGETKIKDTLALVGSDKIILQEDNNVIQFKTSGMKIDLGAIAKGFAVDCAVRKLKQAGIKSCLINAGGDIYCLGDKSEMPWRVAIQDPQKKGILAGNLELKDRAVATSGGYEQYFIEHGKRYSHIFNPQSGYPAESGIASITVIAPDCLTADALATSIFVLGKFKGEAMAERFKDVSVKVIEENG